MEANHWIDVADCRHPLEALCGHWLSWDESTMFVWHRDTEEDRDVELLDVTSRREVVGWRRIEYTTVTLVGVPTDPECTTSMQICGCDSEVAYTNIGATVLFPAAAVHRTVRGCVGHEKLAVFWGYSGEGAAPSL